MNPTRSKKRDMKKTPPVQDGQPRDADVLGLALADPHKRAFLPAMGAAQIIVACAADAAGADAYGVKVADIASGWLGKRMNLGMVYGTLDALAEAEILKTDLRPSPHGKGRDVTIYKLTRRGRVALRAVRELHIAYPLEERTPHGTQKRPTRAAEVKIE